MSLTEELAELRACQVSDLKKFFKNATESELYLPAAILVAAGAIQQAAEALVNRD